MKIYRPIQNRAYLKSRKNLTRISVCYSCTMIIQSWYMNHGAAIVTLSLLRLVHFESWKICRALKMISNDTKIVRTKSPLQKSCGGTWMDIDNVSGGFETATDRRFGVDFEGYFRLFMRFRTQKANDIHVDYDAPMFSWSTLSTETDSSKISTPADLSYFKKLVIFMTGNG